MSSLIVTQEGAELLFQYGLQYNSKIQAIAHLIGSPYTVAHASTQATLAAKELVVAGYSPLTLVSPASPWSLIALANGYELVNQPPPWTFNGACTVYGWWLASGAGTYSLFGALWDTPYVFGAAGGQFYAVFSPTLTSLP